MRVPPVMFFAVSLLFLMAFEASFAQDWVKPSAGRPEYVQDRTECAQDAQSMALEGGAFERDVVECLLSKGWQRTVVMSKPVYCADKEAAISCRPGATEEMYKKDRAECVNQMMQTVGTPIRGQVGEGSEVSSYLQFRGKRTRLIFRERNFNT